MLMVEFTGKPSIGSSGQGTYGLSLNSSAPVPTADNEIQESEDVMFGGAFDEILVTTGGSSLVAVDRIVLPSDMKVFMAQNPVLLAFSSAGTRAVSVRLVFQRVRFSIQELGGLIAFRR